MSAKPGSGVADIVSTASYPASCANAMTCNQPISTTDPKGNITDYTYDPTHGGISSVTAPGATTGGVRRQIRMSYTRLDGFYVSYDWDPAGQLTHIRENGAASGPGVLATYGYDDLGRRTSLTRGNGTVTAYAYDPVSRLGSLTHNLSGTAHDLTLGFTYNPAGQIASATRSNDAYAWGGYANQTVTSSVNGLNQLTAAGTTAITHDARGNTGAIGAATYSYSSENMLKAASGGVTLYYDAMLRLSEYNAATSTRFVYDGAAMIAEVANPSGAVTRRYVHGPGSDEPLLWYEGSGTSDRRWLHADERGSIVAVSNASGVATSINAYDEYGVPAAGNVGRFGYTGQAWLPEIGMWHYKARMYAPSLGRFLQADPIGYADGMNMYGYVTGDPVNLVDPSGMKSYTYYWNGDQLIRETWDDNGFFVGTTNVTPNSGGSWGGGWGSGTGGAGWTGGGGGGLASGGGGGSSGGGGSAAPSPAPQEEPERGRPNCCFSAGYKLGEVADDLGGVGQVVGAGAIGVGAASIALGGSGSIVMAWGANAYTIGGTIRNVGEGLKVIGGKPFEPDSFISDTIIRMSGIDKVGSAVTGLIGEGITNSFKAEDPCR